MAKKLNGCHLRLLRMIETLFYFIYIFMINFCNLQVKFNLHAILSNMLILIYLTFYRN